MTKFFSIVILVLMAFVPARAQIQHGSVLGIVTDSSGAVVIDADVVLKNSLTGNATRHPTNSRGEFNFNNVAFEQYSLQVTANGFEFFSQTIAVRSNLPTRIEIKLRVAGTTAAINVVSHEGLVAPDSSTSSVSISEEFIKRNPRTNRNRGLQEVLATTPGTATENNGLVHVRGVDDGVLYVMDGIPISDRLDAVSASPIDTDAINSMQIITGNIPAEFGGRSAAVVIVHPKSGIDSPLVGRPARTTRRRRRLRQIRSPQRATITARTSTPEGYRRKSPRRSRGRSR